MTIFPTQYSTLSSIALGEFVQTTYGLEGITCRLLVRNVSDVYLLEHQSTKYIFKVYRNPYRSLDMIKGEVELLRILKDSRVPVSYGIEDLSGNAIQTFQAAEGVRHGVLFNFAVGKVEINPDELQLAIIGKNIAAMHNITSGCRLPYERPVYDLETTLYRPLELMKHRFAGLPEEYAYLTEKAEKAVKKLNELNPETFSYGYCHYDLLPKNFHFDEQNNITFFDFDWAGKGYLVNDLMTFYVQLFFLVYMNRITQAEADTKFGLLIDGYKQNGAISGKELAAIPYLGVLFWVYAFGFYEENFDDFSNTFLTPRFIKERVELIKKWVEWYCKF
jgi:Ser/Thr protein kinase RdoA (MazF antagonist)